MNYNDAFAVDDVHYIKRKNELSYQSPKFQLNNYDYYQPKLVDDFYLKYFTQELLFETDILDLEEFLEYHFDYCDNPDKYFSILDFKIIPKIEEIVEYAQPNLEAGGYHNEIKLEDGFVQNESVIHNSKYDYGSMYHYTAFNNLQYNLKKRAEIITSFLAKYKDKRVVKPLKWIAGPSQLAIIIRELIDKGYMEADKRRGDINSSSLSRDLFQAFSIEDCDSPKSIEIYLSPGNKRYTKAKEIFDKRGFSIPLADFT